MAPHYSILLKAALVAITALQATATSRRHALRAPSLESQLGKLPDLPPLGGVSGIAAAINNIPGAAAFFTGQQANSQGPTMAELTGIPDNYDPSAPGNQVSPWSAGAPAPSALVPAPFAPVPGMLPPGMPPPGLPAPVAAPGMKPDPDRFLPRVTMLLTCKALELQVEKVCDSAPLYQAIHQFGNDLAMCTAAMGKIAELSMLFAEYFGPGATCNTKMEGWKFEKFKSKEKCQDQIRREEFKDRCILIP